MTWVNSCNMSIEKAESLYQGWIEDNRNPKRGFVEGLFFDFRYGRCKHKVSCLHTCDECIKSDEECLTYLNSLRERVKEYNSQNFDKANQKEESGKKEEYSSPATNIHLSEHLKVLGLKKGFTQEGLKKSWREKVKENHPDRIANMSDELKKYATQRVQKINGAYDALKQ